MVELKATTVAWQCFDQWFSGSRCEVCQWNFWLGLRMIAESMRWDKVEEESDGIGFRRGFLVVFFLVFRPMKSGVEGGLVEMIVL